MCDYVYLQGVNRNTRCNLPCLGDKCFKHKKYENNEKTSSEVKIINALMDITKIMDKLKRDLNIDDSLASIPRDPKLKEQRLLFKKQREIRHKKREDELNDTTVSIDKFHYKSSGSKKGGSKTNKKL